MLEISEARGLGLVNKLSLGAGRSLSPSHPLMLLDCKNMMVAATGYDLINLIACGYCIRSEAVTALTALAITRNIYNQMLLN